MQDLMASSSELVDHKLSVCLSPCKHVGDAMVTLETLFGLSILGYCTLAYVDVINRSFKGNRNTTILIV